MCMKRGLLDLRRRARSVFIVILLIPVVYARNRQPSAEEVVLKSKAVLDLGYMHGSFKIRQSLYSGFLCECVRLCCCASLRKVRAVHAGINVQLVEAP